ncbi:GMC family oxidoreductase [Kibdelosporangium philippinense]|uniref:GMC family oxidoreductase n=1 Tax=Kibdelosporangium philippinense TaxID=211113 RepID=A0ABS8Z333_9PSEU|nr:GMC family oxidoreductase [Kibdelosporangium philippinense]MCE7002346.1 GMC family oxidoreductase [Kibdelosporangium philippinense]
MRTFEADDAVVVVIGSGPGGATLAHQLAMRSVPVVVLEAGPWIANEEFVNDDNKAFEQLSWLEPRLATGSWSLATDFPSLPAWNARCVGGTAVLWTGVCPRFKAHEFRALSTYGGVDGAALADWPIGLAELEPFYSSAEQAIGVTHRHGKKPLPANNNYKVLAEGARRVGYRHYATGPYAGNAEPYDGRPATLQDGFNSQGDKHGSKWSPLVREIPRAIATGNVEVRTQCQAVQITLGADGRADSVIYADPSGALHRQRAVAVAVAGNAIETPRLLMLSAESRHPDGLANSSGQLGRNYMRHATGVVHGQFPEPVHHYRGENMAGVVSDESRHDPARGFVGGYYMEMISQGLPSFVTFATPGAWGRAYTEIIEAYTHTASIWICGEDMPQPTNRVTLSDTLKDSVGLPAPEVHYDDHPNDLALRTHAYGQAEAIMSAVGATRLLRSPAMPSGHNMGTARMSTDPATGVVNAFGQAHDVNNLYICDGSIFTTGAAANPTLTIVALAMRQAAYLTNQLDRW